MIQQTIDLAGLVHGVNTHLRGARKLDVAVAKLADWSDLTVTLGRDEQLHAIAHQYGRSVTLALVAIHLFQKDPGERITKNFHGEIRDAVNNLRLSPGNDASTVALNLRVLTEAWNDTTGFNKPPPAYVKN